jgi:4-hydroxyphenylpyruvate dioxygenase-like putative hemolysin
VKTRESELETIHIRKIMQSSSRIRGFGRQKREKRKRNLGFSGEKKHRVRERERERESRVCFVCRERERERERERVRVTGIVYWCVAMNPGDAKQANGRAPRLEEKKAR